MTREEYIKKMNEDDEWAPGWDAIEAEFARLYPGSEPAHYATAIQSRAMFASRIRQESGTEYLDGFSVYDMGNGCRHIVTFGMSELYPDKEAYGKEFSRWGYEMTIKLREATAEGCLWAMDMLSNLARYTYTSERWFEPYECIHGGEPLHKGTDSLITSLITVADTAAQPQDTVHGRLEFIQLVGITESEYQAIQRDYDNIYKLAELMKRDNPGLITDMERTVSYL